jgi:cell wall-associated NlpC family hydrolase
LAHIGRNWVGSKARRTGGLPNALPQNAEGQVPPAFSSKTSPLRRKSSILSLAVTAVIVPGLFATIALPAYAFSPTPSSGAADASQALQDLKAAGAQTVVVDSDAAATTVARDGFSATSAAEMERAALATVYASYSGPSVADLLANPPYPNFDLGQVAAVAQQYVGSPYVYGGSDPSGFDCSGFVMYVYAQFGISLPHSVSGSAAVGTAISRDAALPGDIVILPGHSGIYLGNGMFIDAPDYGRTVQVRAIYEDDYYIVRVGI